MSKPQRPVAPATAPETPPVIEPETVTSPEPAIEQGPPEPEAIPQVAPETTSVDPTATVIETVGTVIETVGTVIETNTAIQSMGFASPESEDQEINGTVITTFTGIQERMIVADAEIAELDA